MRASDLFAGNTLSMYLNMYLQVTGRESAFVRLLPGVDLHVPIEAAGVLQHLVALLARHTWLPVVPHITSPDAAFRWG